MTINEASGGDIIPADLCQILKDDAALNMSANLENSSVATILEKKKSQFSFQSQRRAMSKNVSTSVQL